MAPHATESEIGITRYEHAGKLEPPHRHKQEFEFQYMVAGLTAYLDLTTTTKEHVFRKGDFYVIEPGVVYAQKSAPGTEILSSKCHREMIRWRWILFPKLRRGFENRSKNRTAGMARRDYFYDQEAQKPNSIRPAACATLVRFERQHSAVAQEGQR
jgi:hypothetical protein